LAHGEDNGSGEGVGRNGDLFVELLDVLRHSRLVQETSSLSEFKGLVFRREELWAK
jgi:hypothetical protein